MSDKRRMITIGVVVGLFIVANIIAGIYKWGSSGTAPDKQLAQTEKTAETGDRPQQINEQKNEGQVSPAAMAEPEEKKEPGETVGDSVVEVEEEAQSAEGTQLETDAGQSESQPQIASNDNEKADLEKEIIRLRNELREKNVLAARNQQLSDQIRDCSVSRDRLLKEMAEVQANSSKYKELASRNEELTNQSREYSDTTKKLENEISELQARIDQYQNLAAENQELQEKLEDLNRQNEELKERLDKIRAMVDVE